MDDPQRIRAACAVHAMSKVRCYRLTGLTGDSYRLFVLPTIVPGLLVLAPATPTAYGQGSNTPPEECLHFAHETVARERTPRLRAKCQHPEHLLVLRLHQALFPVLVIQSLKIHPFPRKVHTQSGPVESPQVDNVTGHGRASRRSERAPRRALRSCFPLEKTLPPQSREAPQATPVCSLEHTGVALSGRPSESSENPIPPLNKR